MTSPAQPTVARLAFTRLVIGACCLVLLSVCSVEAQDGLAHFDVSAALGEGYRLLNEVRFDRAEDVREYAYVLERAPQNVQALIGRARLAGWTGDLDKAYRFLQMAFAVDTTDTIITQQIESIKRSAKELSHSRMQSFVPLALI